MNSRVKLDLDGLHSGASLVRFIQRSDWSFIFQFDWPIFGQLDVQHVEVRVTSHGYHVVFSVTNQIPPLYLVLLQRSLGSDVKRECFNFRRITTIKKMRSWNVLYSYKFDAQGNFLSQEKPDARLSKKIATLIKGFQEMQ